MNAKKNSRGYFFNLIGVSSGISTKGVTAVYCTNIHKTFTQGMRVCVGTRQNMADNVAIRQLWKHSCRKNP